MSADGRSDISLSYPGAQPSASSSAPLATSGVAGNGSVAGGSVRYEDTPERVLYEKERGEEFLYLRRAAQVVLRHWFLVLLVTVTIPVTVFVIDTYHREKVYVTRMRCQVIPADDRQSLPFNLDWTAPSEEEFEDVSQLLGRQEVKEAFLEFLALEISERETMGEPAEGASGQELGLLRTMIGADRKPTAEFAAIYGSISARSVADNEIEFWVRGEHGNVQPAIIRLTVKSMNDFVVNRRMAALRALIDELQRLWDKNNAELRAVHNGLVQLARELEPEDGSGQSLENHTWRINQLEMERHRTETAVAEGEWRLENARREARWSELTKRLRIHSLEDAAQVLSGSNPLRRKWRDLEAKFAELSPRMTKEHPQMVALSEEIAAIKRVLRQRGEVNSKGELPPIATQAEEDAIREILKVTEELELAQLRLRRIKKALVEKRRQAMLSGATAEQGAVIPGMEEKIGEREALLEKQSAHRAFGRRIYDRLSEVRLISDRTAKENRFVPLGDPSTFLESPQVKMDVALGIVLGLIIGCSAAFLRESIDNHVRTPFDAYYHFRLPYLGVVPYSSSAPSLFIDPEHPDSHIAEIYAQLRNNVRYGGPGQPQRCLLVASATQGEGKSTLSVNLSISYALEGNNVLLVDADLRRPRGESILGLDAGSGNGLALADYLAGNAEWRDVAVATTVPGLTMVPARERVRNPAKLIASERMKALLEEAQEVYDVVVIDSPAILPVVDATYLAPQARGTLVVIGAEEVEIPEVRMALYRLRHVGAPILGFALNKVREALSGYYYGYRYRSGYAGTYHNAYEGGE